PNDAKAYRERGCSWMQAGNMAKAIQDLSVAIEIEPKNHEFYQWRGLAQYQEKQLKAAEKDFTQVLTLKPEFVPAMLTRGAARRSRSVRGGPSHRGRRSRRWAAWMSGWTTVRTIANMVHRRKET